MFSKKHSVHLFRLKWTGIIWPGLVKLRLFAPRLRAPEWSRACQLVITSWVVSSVYKEWMRDPRWCDGWSNVNGVRHPLAAQFWGEANAGEGGGGQPQNARGRAPIAIPPLCHPPPPPCFTYPAIAALAAPRGIPGEGRANARNAGWALALQCRWA